MKAQRTTNGNPTNQYASLRTGNFTSLPQKNNYPNAYTPEMVYELSPRQKAPVEVNISLTSDRIPRYKEFHQQLVTAVNNQNATKATTIRRTVKRDLQQTIDLFFPDTHTKLFHTLGVWQGGFEQSFRLVFPHNTDEVTYAAVKIAQGFAQESIHFICPVKESNVTRPIGLASDKGYVFTPFRTFALKTPLTIPEFDKIIGQSGLGGAQLSPNGRIVTIYNAYNVEQSTDKQSAEAATQQWEEGATALFRNLQQHGIAKATMRFGEFRSYGASTWSATRMYDQLDSDLNVTEQYRESIQQLSQQIETIKNKPALLLASSIRTLYPLQKAA